MCTSCQQPWCHGAPSVANIPIQEVTALDATHTCATALREPLALREAAILSIKMMAVQIPTLRDMLTP